MAAYRTIASPATVEIVEKKSRFIGQIAPAQAEEEALAFLEAVRAEHRMARHNVYAYVLRSGRVRYSDDGEPGGTAGMPTLEAVQHADLVDVAVVVTRYFGGTLLGTGGLVRAYAAATRAASCAAKHRAGGGKASPSADGRRRVACTQAGSEPRASSQFAARRLADRREGRQGPHRAMRRQSLRLLGRQEIERQRRAGSYQHEAGQGQMERPHLRSQQRQHLRFHHRSEEPRHAARPGLRIRRHVLRRPDLDAGELIDEES